MSENSKIQWTDSTWNPLTGCTKYSEGCKLCYFMVLHTRRHEAWKAGRWPDAPVQYHKPATELQFFEDRVKDPMHWRKPRMVFLDSLSDLFHKDVPNEFIDRLFVVMALTQRHTYQILTKRTDRMRDYMCDPWRVERIYDQWHSIAGESPEIPSWPLPNVWMGTSIENQAAAEERIPYLLQIPAKVRFLSCEPLLGTVNLWEHGFCEYGPAAVSPGKRSADWVIAGCESGKGARSMQTEWAESLRDQCAAAGVPFFMKQMVVGGKLRHELADFPESLRIREFPQATEVKP